MYTVHKWLKSIDFNKVRKKVARKRTYSGGKNTADLTKTKFYRYFLFGLVTDKNKLISWSI